MEASLIRILCVDDHPVVREGLRAVFSLQPDMQIVATADNGLEAIRLFREHRPDVTVMDLKMPGMSGLQAMEQIRREFPDANIIVLTTYAGDEDIFQAVQAGAATYLLKESIADELVRVVREVFQGRRPISENIAAGLA